MKVLLLHPENSPWEGPWAEFKWDLVIDLGWAGRHAYPQWEQKLQCPVLNLYSYVQEIEVLREFKRILDQGRGRLLDSEGLDWWEIVSVMVRLELWTLFLVSKLVRHLKQVKYVVASRSNLNVRGFGLLLGVPIETLSGRKITSPWHRALHYMRAASKLSLPQLVNIALDKWDPVYAVRRWIARKNHSSHEPVVLLPTPYINVSRLVAEYARMLPTRQFVLVATRPSGRQLTDPPSNLTMVSLASYVPPATPDREEQRCLLAAWERFKVEVIRNVKELALADQLGVFNRFPALLAQGLVIRDAWKQVFEEMEIDTVLCGDENNPFTRMPVILGKNRGIRTVYCHHGMLDAGLLINEQLSDIYLTKGEMERDYLIRNCELSPEKVVVGSPNHSPSGCDGAAKMERSSTSAIAFFSEPYELYFGRVEEAYAEIIPRLCVVARQTGRRVILKLHPFESRRERMKIVNRVLSIEQRRLVEIIDTPLSSELLKETWFGVTVESSVAVECALQSVPCFLCGWLDLNLYGYTEQYAKYGAGYVLNSPDDIERIPELLCRYSIAPDVKQKLWQPIAPQELDRLLSGSVSGIPVKSTAGSSHADNSH